ncbi:MAG: di-heme oxidoredictase family protein [Marinicella sp.]
MKSNQVLIRSLLITTFVLLSGSAFGQLVECAQAGINTTDVPNGCIAKSLENQIGSGHGDVETFGSAVFLIKRDPARSIRRGRQLFQRKFTLAEGHGPRVNDFSTGDITTSRALGAGFADSCAACHGRPKGSAGFGGDVVTRPDSRDAPHLFGLGLVEQLADEMTRDLRAIQFEAIAEASSRNREITTELRSKGVRFGRISASPDGTVETSEVEGIDADLRVKPFFHHGQTISIREFIMGAFKDEMGLQAWDPVLCAATDPVSPLLMTSPSGFVYDPELDDFERPPACDSIADPDGDGMSNEIDPALVDHMEFYLLNYFKPGQYRTNRETDRGFRVMREIGCLSCHTPNLVINSDRRVADVETVYDSERGIFNDLYATASTRFSVVDDGNQYPLILPEGNEFIVRNIFSDLKRHDLGPAFHERDFDGSVVTEFVTEPLWGVGSTPPYGHDGRSINLDAVIRRHGGEAHNAKRSYERLNSRDQQNVLAFLNTLVLFPPDDTASNLNTGDPTNHDAIQEPSVHGTINLGALFQIEEESPE